MHLSTSEIVLSNQARKDISGALNRSGTSRDGHNVLIYNNSEIANIISDHPDLAANYTTNYAPEDLNEDLDVLFNIRGADIHSYETMEWIYNGGTWVVSGPVTYILLKIGALFLEINMVLLYGSQSISFIDQSHWLGKT